MEAKDESNIQPLLLFSSITIAFENYGLENNGLPLLFQTLSRYQYLNNEQFKEAEETIRTAILMKPYKGGSNIQAAIEKSGYSPKSTRSESKLGISVFI